MVGISSVVALLGQRFGRLVVLEQVESIGGDATWRCRCDCGHETKVRGRSLRHGDTKSCGCLKQEVLLDRAADITGEKFGRWIAVKRVPNPHKNGAAWLCRCSCGNESIVTASNLRWGRSSSCGCLFREESAKRMSLPRGQAAKNHVLHSYKRSAEVRGLEWALLDEHFWLLISSDCHYCGLPPSRPLPTNVRRRETCKDFVRNGVDRKNNSIGYVVENVVTCCTTCNKFKKSMTYEEFTAYLDRVRDFRLRLKTRSAEESS